MSVRNRKTLLLIPLALLLAVLISRAQEAPKPTAPPGVETVKDDKGVEFHIPADWPKGYPLPSQKPNCVRCHIDKGGDISAAVFNYSLSTHDRQDLSCVTCHGGNVDNDEMAHEGDFISGKLSALMERCSNCHTREDRFFRQSAHFNEKIRFDFPNCSTCHDNHSVGKGNFHLADSCTSCHGVKAQARTGSEESEIIWKARSEGPKGNNIAVTLAAQKNGQPLSVEVQSVDIGTEVVVNLKTDDKGKSLSTAEEVIEAIKAKKEIYPIMSAEEGGDSLGEGVVNPAPRFALVGGAGIETKYPTYAEIVKANDDLWDALMLLRKSPEPGPDPLEEKIAKTRNLAMRLLHTVAKTPDPEESKALAERSAALKKEIQDFLAKEPEKRF